MAAILLNVQAGDEVIMPSFTFVSTANAFVLRGAVPVFIDIKPDTLCIDDSLIKNVISSRTKGIVPVHYAGNACEMDQIMQLASDYKLWVIEDAAQAFFSSYKSKFLGSIGDLGCLSFHETKNVISGEGGALLINSSQFIERAEIVWEKGTNRKKFFRGEIDKYTWVDIGSSFLPSELVASFLFAQLEHADKIVSQRYRLHSLYCDHLRALEIEGLIRLPVYNSNCHHNGHILYLIARSNNERNKLINHLKARNVMAVFHYIPLHLSPGGMKFGVTRSCMKVTQDISERLVRLPLYYEMNDVDVEKVCMLIKKFYNKI
jgi:dTDP-4-amino-4,6-dideoxygalactose transaminase